MDFSNLHKKILQGLILFSTALLIIFVILFTKSFGTQKIYYTLMSIDKQVILVVVLLTLFNTIVLLPLRMYGILRASNFDLSLKDTVLIFLSSIPIMNLTPGQKLLASAFISYLLWLYTRKSGEECSVYYLLDITVTFFITTFVVLLLTMGLGVPPELYPLWTKMMILIILGCLIAISFILFSELYLLRGEQKNEKLKRAKKIYILYKKAFRKTITDFKNFVFIYGVTILLYFCGYFQIMLIMNSMGIDLSVQEISVAEALISIITIIPTTPGDIGLLEGAQMYVYSHFNIPKEKILVFYLINRSIIFFIPTVLGAIVFYILYFTKLKDIIGDKQ